MIQIIITGGTIDKDYNCLDGSLYFPKTFIPKIFKQANLCQKNIDYKVVLQKDSGDFSTKDTKLIIDEICKSDYQQIIVTHGTDTLVDTARALKNKLLQLNLNKLVIFVGAMRPYAFRNSDAAFNLGYALGVLDNKSVKLEKGVFICMNGNTLDADNCVKNFSKGQFFPIY